jgi:hypothetical protein
MNDLTQYNSVRAQLRAGDVIVFWGNPLDPLTLAIEAFNDGPSHSAIVRQPIDNWGDDVIIEQSTRPILIAHSSKDGVQNEPLGVTLANYGANAKGAALLLSDAARARLDLMKFYEWIGECDGLVTYDTRDLFEFLLREIPIAGAREWQQESSKAMVCSGFVTSTLIKSGVLSPGINWTQWGPQQLVECGIYKACVPLLGNPTLTRFNRLTA